MKTIQVLVSTYNGEKYLAQQLDSILAQDCQDKTQLLVRVRDDGSTDGTQKILEDFAERYPQQLVWKQGENVGVIRSFFELLSEAPEAEYYAFSDQDDYWMPDKLSAAIQKLETMDAQNPQEPHLYCCRPKLVDVELQEIVSQIKRPPVRASFENALVENVVVGCTAVFNSVLRDYVVWELPRFTVMHDWWMYLVASALGKVYYDETPHICYRQHGGNVLGTKTNRWEEFVMRLKRFGSTRGNISSQVGELVRIYGKDYADNQNMQKAQKMLLAKTSLPKRVRFFHRAGIYRQRTMDNLIFKVILWIGNY